MLQNCIVITIIVLLSFPLYAHRYGWQCLHSRVKNEACPFSLLSEVMLVELANTLSFLNVLLIHSTDIY